MCKLPFNENEVSKNFIASYKARLDDGWEVIDFLSGFTNEDSGGYIVTLKKVKENVRRDGYVEKEAWYTMMLYRLNDGKIQVVEDNASHFRNGIYNWIFPIN